MPLTFRRVCIDTMFAGQSARVFRLVASGDEGERRNPFVANNADRRNGEYAEVGVDQAGRQM